jgi:3-oxoacyl-[acyl-carrier protein] reductase
VNLDLDGRKALVTGASRGIGLAVARALAAEGARVALVARGAAELRKALASLGGAARGHAAFAVDLARESGPRTLLARLRGFGSPGVVVHNAGGTLDVRDPLCSLADWRAVLRLNLEVAVELNARLIPPMRKARWGRIVHVTSVSGGENLGPAPYCAAKAALNAYTKSFGRIFAADGIVVSAVAPGAVLSPGGPWEKAGRERPAHVRKYLRDQVPMRRFGGAEEVAAMVAFLCSPRASQCAGAVVPVDGGLGRAFTA